MSVVLNSVKRYWDVFSEFKGDFKPQWASNGYRQNKVFGRTYSYNPDRATFTGGIERSIVSSLYNRIAIDVSAIDIRHCRISKDGQYLETINDSLNKCFSINANIDQSGRQFIQDLAITIFDDGCAAVVPVDLGDNRTETGAYDIKSMRVGRIREWRPDDVRVSIYNDRTGDRDEIWVPKKLVAIIENPLYSIMNEPNSILQRLIKKLNILDAIDEQSGSGKLDLIIQLPYVIKSETRRAEAEKRREMIADQLANSQYGIAYADAAERITQLNRPVENNLLDQIKYLTGMLYGQLGISENIQNGTASDQEMLNYHNRTIEPVISAICDAMRYKFLSEDSLNAGYTIKYIKDPFKLSPIDKIAELADKFTRNEIMSSNEFRSVLGLTRVNDPEADVLRNKNLNKANDQSYEDPPQDDTIERYQNENQNYNAEERSDT